MPSKLRVYSALLGGGLIALALWAGIAYGIGSGRGSRLVASVAVAASIAVAPDALAHAKRHLERRRHAALDQETYVSSALDSGIERGSFIEATRERFEANDEFLAVEERTFPEGPGLIVEYTRYHGTFVRLSKARRIVVTGTDNRATRAVVDTLERRWSTALVPASTNPLLGPIPVRGAPRVFLTVLLTAMAVLNLMLIAGAAYPTPTYNPGEKTALMTYDLQATVDPSTSETDASINKAGFLVRVLREESTEIRWEAGLNGSREPPDHDAAGISKDIVRLLDTARASGPDQHQRERIRLIEREHERAREAVNAAVSATANATAESAS